MIKIPEELKAKVNREYQIGENHVRHWRQRTIDMMNASLNEEVPDGSIKIDLVKENIEFEKANFMTDSIDVRFITDEGVLGKRIVENAQKVAKFDYEDLDMDYMKEDIIDDNAYKGIAVTTFDLWDNDEVQPIVGVIDPLTVIPDPKCHNGSQMRFVGFERRLNKLDIEENDAFDVEGLSLDNAQDTQTLRNAQFATNNANIYDDNEGLVPVYDHMTTWKGKKVLLTFVNERAECIRMIELEPLTSAEKKNPLKIAFPVQFHRRKSKKGRWAGYSILEEVQNTEDVVTLLKNLEIKLAKLQANGGDTLISSSLSIDIGELNGDAGGRFIPVVQEANMPLGNQVFSMPVPTVGQQAIQTGQSLIERSKRNTGYTDVAMGQSAPGSQTAREVQALAQSANKIVAFVAMNYLRGMRDFWYAWYRSYSLNMSPKAKKIIALFESGGTSHTLTKKDFISNGKVLIEITSESQELIKNEKNVTKLLAVANLIIPNLQKGSPLNNFLRNVVDKSSINGVSGEDIIPLSLDEMKAYDNLELLNRNIKLRSTPQPGADLDTYLTIYSKGIKTEALNEAIQMIKEIKAKIPAQIPQMGQENAQSASMAMNMLSNQQPLNPTM